MKHYNLKYKTLDSLIADVKSDFRSYDLDNMIETQDLIRAAKWVTRDLGLRIYMTKEAVLDVDYNKAKLPDDFYTFNYGLLCASGTVTSIIPGGTTTIEVPYPTYQSAPDAISLCTDGSVCPKPGCKCDNCKKCAEIIVVKGYNPLQPYGDPCVTPRVFMDCKGDSFELIQVVGTQKTTWRQMLPLKLVNTDYSVLNCMCPNVYTNCVDEITIKDGFMGTSFKCGKVYINYEGHLEDDKGNILVPEHETLALYYEYKLKDRILENLYNNGEEVERKLDRNTLRLRNARIEALSLVNMPDFAEIKNVYELNRKAYNSRYVDMFRSCYG